MATTTAPEIRDVQTALSAGATALVLELEPSHGIAIAAEISHEQLAHVVLVLPRWPHPDAVLPVGELVTTLESVAERLTAEPSSNVVFVLDGDRRRSIERSVPDGRVDNRYDLAPAELPNLTVLRHAGIQRVVRVTRL